MFATTVGFSKLSHAFLACVKKGTIVRSGQDCRLVITLPDGLTVIIVADGHGGDGQYYSLSAVSYIQCLIREEYIQDFLMIPDVLNALLVHVNEQVVAQNIGRHGGTTLSVMVFRCHVFADEKIVEVCSSYVGDSPMYARVNGQIHDMGGIDNCDNFDAIQKYYQYCKLYGREPDEIVYSRFNCSGYRDPDLTPYGVEGTLPVVDNQDGEPVLNEESFKKILQLWPEYTEGTTTQTLGVISMKFDLGYKPFGNSIQPGSVQALTGIGDIGVNGILKHAGCVPTAQYRTFSCPSTSTIELAVMSDGMSDLGTPTQVMDLLESCIGLDSDQSKMMIAHHVQSIAPDLYDKYYSDRRSSFVHDDVTAVYYNL